MSIAKTFFIAIASSIISIAMSLVYNKLYFDSLGADFSLVVTPIGIISACLIGGLLLAWGNFFALKLFKSKGQIIFNLSAGVLSFASLIGVFATTLPLEIEFPEMFPGLVSPMHFFPVMAHLALLPLFVSKD